MQDRGLRYELAIIGGGGLMMLGLINRPTRDLDVVALVHASEMHNADPLPDELQQAVRDVAEVHDVDENWLNPGPTDLLRHGLPKGFMERATTRAYGSLTLQIASREDQVFFKLFAAVDSSPRSKHTADLRLLNPSREELLAAARWARTHDPSEGFRTLLHSALVQLGVTDHGEP